MNKKFKNPTIYIGAILALSLLILFASPQIFFRHETIIYPIKAEVINYTNSTATPIGVSGDSDAVNFGRLPPSSNSTKFLEFKNNNIVEAKTVFEIEGNISPFITAPKDIMLKPGDEAKISLKFHPEIVGNYTGKITLKSYIPLYSASSWFFRLV
ncbi:MAG: hypothetical protein KAT91_03645 [Candidatus Aenigmarchaeota archaeon]|nr:hypothetical protein [Candidatus Aenigmarchaeota archaeon]